jgi:hypothetical protein
MRFACVCLLFLVVGEARIGETNSAFSIQDNSPDYWKLQAHLLTEDVLKDAIDLASLDRALLFGRLAEIWWSQDVERARILLQKAIAEVESRSADDNKSDRLRRNSVLTTLLTIAAPLDERYTDQLTEMLKPRAGKPIDQEASESATALAQAALTVLDVDPTRAAALGSASLRAGRSRSLANVLSRLRLRRKALGDALFNEALMTAAGGSDGELLTSLIIIAFNGPAPSDDLRRSVVVAIEREFVGNSRQTAVNRGCSLAPTIAPLLGEFDRVLPQSAATIRGGLIRCQKSHNPSSDATVDRILNNERVETVSDLLDAANKARTIDDRVLFLGRAANLAAQQGNFEQAVTILDGIAEEERKALGDVWSDWRWDFAASAAVARLKADDRYGMEKIIASSPVNLRAFVQVAVAEALADYGDTAGAVELLEAARKAFLKLDDMPNMFDWYISLLGRYAKLAPKEGPQVFRDFVTVNNRARSHANEKSEPRSDTLQPLKLPASVVQIDLPIMKDASSALAPLSMRVRARLGLVKSLLESARADSRANPKQKRHHIQNKL